MTTSQLIKMLESSLERHGDKPIRVAGEWQEWGHAVTGVWDNPDCMTLAVPDLKGK